MRFCQLDRIIEITEDRIVAVRCLTLSEDYLQDHFPRFPVMPGVLMVEALFQASMFLVRHRENFENSMVVLREAKNIKFGDFVEPGHQLLINSTIKKFDTDFVTVQVKATTRSSTAVGGRMVLERYNLADREKGSVEVDDFMRMRFQRQFRLLCGPRFESTGELDVPAALSEITAV